MQVNINDLKRLREGTQAGVSDCRQALEDARGDYKKARELLTQRGRAKAARKVGKETTQGLIESYVHNGKVGVLVDLRCETDFVARTDEFKYLAHEITLQIASMNPKDVVALLKQQYIREPTITIEDVLKQAIAKLGENITVFRFSRVARGE